MGKNNTNYSTDTGGRLACACVLYYILISGLFFANSAFFLSKFFSRSRFTFSPDSWRASESYQETRVIRQLRAKKWKAVTFMMPVLTARIMCSSALSDAPSVVCCVSAGIHGGGSYHLWDSCRCITRCHWLSFAKPTALHHPSIREQRRTIHCLWIIFSGMFQIYWFSKILTSKVHLPYLRFDHTEFDKERAEVLNEGCRSHGTFYTMKGWVVVYTWFIRRLTWRSYRTTPLPPYFRRKI